MRKRIGTRHGFLVALILACGLAAGYHLDLLGHAAYAFERGKLKADREHLREITDSDVVALEQLSQAFSLIAEVVKPSVVYIEAVSTNRELNRELRKLFGERKFQPRPRTGTGSGIIIDEDGYIVTNNHVVEEAEALRVTLVDGRQFRAKVVGTDPKTDIAVIKIKCRHLHPVRFGDSDALKVGNIVLAIGSPFRLGHSVSHGIISAIGRSEVDVDIDYQNWLQTDAPINPGNSGGPLINTRGEVIGINTAIATESGVGQGVSFAIPSNTIRLVSAKLKTGQAFVRGYLGVGIAPVSPKVAAAYGVEVATGALVTAVGRKTPAAHAGIKPEDIILEINETRVKTREHLQELIAATEPGSVVDMTIWRNGALLHLDVTIAPQPDGFSTTGTLRPADTDSDRDSARSEDDAAEIEEPATERSSEDGGAVRFDLLGFEAATVSPALAKRFTLDEHVQNGALVTEVDPTGEAYAVGLRPGQVVAGANGRRIHNVRELRQALTPETIARGVRLRVKVRRNTADAYIVLQVR
ncbi:MAG: trypsin-like peptidase domain-containing protein [Phycisphaerae bacterium]